MLFCGRRATPDAVRTDTVQVRKRRRQISPDHLVTLKADNLRRLVQLAVEQDMRFRVRKARARGVRVHRDAQVPYMIAVCLVRCVPR
jgi:uncharacterized protein YqfA (UPF0365 family)